MPLRILSLLLCLLVAGPMSLPAHAVARPETRVGDFFPSPLKSASADRDQTAGLRWENPGCGYDFASGVCKYLYAHADPVNGIDPSGHEFNMIGLMAATGIQMYLRSVYDTIVLSTGFAMEKTILGVQAGKTAEAIVLEYTVEAVVGAVAGFALGKVIGRALDLGDAVPPATGLFKNPELIRLPLGTRVYRVHLPKNSTSQIYGRFWTTVDPRKVANFADAAGLPQHVAQALRNGEAKLLVARVINNENVLGRAAENIGGNRGGLFEVQFSNAPSQVQVLEELPFQQMW